VDEVVEHEKPVSLPEIHKVSNMMVDTIECKSSMSYSMHSEKSISTIDNCNYDVCEDVLDVPHILRKQIDVPESKEMSILGFEDMPEEPNLIVQTDIDHIWNGLDTSEYEKYLSLLNDWFSAYHRLPRKQSELSLVGFDLEFAGLFDKSHFREQIKEFALRLYVASEDHDMLSSKFVKYIEKMLVKKGGVKERVLEYVSGLW